MRLKFKPWADDYIKNNPNLFIRSIEELREYINGSQKICVEVGCGKGKFIRETAIQNPDVKFIAIERYKTVIVSAAQPLEETPIPNLKFFSEDVDTFINDSSLDGKLDTLYLNFSDPWPKKRHIKRRLTYKTKLDLYEKLLAKDGCIKMKTDNQALFEYSLSSFSKSKWDLDNISLDLHATDRENIVTEYEEKFSELGFRICYLEARKVLNE